jgi:hypothetical protein
MGKIVLTPDIEEIILQRLAEGEALNVICADESIPVAESTVRKRAIEDPSFGAKYARAREVGFDCRGERAVEATKTEEAKKNPQAARLIFDAERWYLGKMKPKTFGDRQTVEHEGTVTHRHEPDTARERVADFLQRKKAEQAAETKH